ncbi:alpha-hydroxy acid oxidase [Endozoicomonas acroporae]|uniref:alpha-hydroxy acid oxidase n=1 Tax=Endozoicomonas acroporae TaxID=1701104 RepID=UPI003D7BB341
MSTPNAKLNLPPGIAGWEDYQRLAQCRVPDFVFNYIDKGIGRDVCLKNNASDLDKVLISSVINDNVEKPDFSTKIFGRNYRYPFSVAPVGAPGILCPGAEHAFALASDRLGIPFSLSTPATTPFEQTADILGAAQWFQLYPPKQPKQRRHLLARLKNSGINVLILTIDVPCIQWREHAAKSEAFNRGWRLPLSVIRYPRWLFRQCVGGRLQLPNIATYAGGLDFKTGQAYIAKNCIWPIGLDDIAKIREEWDGYLVVKGVMHQRVAHQVSSLGVDGIYISNHGGRQLDCAPSTASVIADIRAATPSHIKILADGGVRSGLDILRMLSIGADFVFAGKLPYMAVTGLGVHAAEPTLQLVAHQLETTMVQLGRSTVQELA